MILKPKDNKFFLVQISGYKIGRNRISPLFFIVLKHNKIEPLNNPFNTVPQHVTRLVKES